MQYITIINDDGVPRDFVRDVDCIGDPESISIILLTLYIHTGHEGIG